MFEAIMRHIRNDEDVSYTLFNNVFRLYSKQQLVLSIISPDDKPKQAARFCSEHNIPFKMEFISLNKKDKKGK